MQISRWQFLAAKMNTTPTAKSARPFLGDRAVLPLTYRDAAGVHTATKIEIAGK
jgi:hypothetical protein